MFAKAVPPNPILKPIVNQIELKAKDLFEIEFNRVFAGASLDAR